MTRIFLHALMLGYLLTVASEPAHGERIKDLASVAGVRANYLVGYGLVVGLDGTGDQTSQAPFTVQSLKNMLAQLGVVVPPNVRPQLKNVAAVALHAELPPFAKPGQTVDITVSSIGNAKSLRGGSLLMAPLKGADGQVYAIAQGNVVVGGLGVQAADGSRVSINVPSAGRIPNGATVERAVASPFLSGDSLTLQLNTPDFTTARNVAEAVNKSLGDSTAAALDAGTVRVAAPADPSARVGFVAAVENVTLEAGEAPARVIVNSRTGTIVIGGHVRVRSAAVAHGNLTVSITERQNVSQPDRFSLGQTAITPESTVEVLQENARMFKLDAGVTLDDIVRRVNEVGAAPGDLVAILEALRAAGALRAELIII